MPRTLGALGLILLTFGCDAGVSSNNDRLPDGFDGSAMAKAMEPGDQIEDCTATVAVFDTGDTGSEAAVAWCPDADLDGYIGADASDPFFTGCICLVLLEGSIPEGWVDVTATSDITEDCDDGDDTVATASVTASADNDGDGYGDSSTSALVCGLISGWVADSTDCDDSDAAINPIATESCDAVDNDCDGDVDESGATGESSWYADSDSDTFGNASDSVTACDMPSGYVADSTDCDDGDAAINPAALEVCDSGVDNDCNGMADDDDGALVSFTGTAYWPDSDSDGFGDESASSAWACTVPLGAVEDSSDCDDTDAAVNPDAAEVADDGVDQDCNGSDLVTSSGTDADGDGFDSEATGGDDCDDTDAAVNPDATEVSLDGVDNNCDGAANSSDTIEVCATPESALSGFAWQLWHRDFATDPDGTGTSTWDYPGAAAGTGELCASMTVSDGDVVLINGPFDIDGDGVFGEEYESDGSCAASDGTCDGVWRTCSTATTSAA
jgi:hypothetical protein